MVKHNAQGIAISILAGIVVFFAMPAMLSPLLERSVWIYLPVFATGYFVIAFVLALFWPAIGWKTGLWLFLLWPAILLFTVFLSADKPWDWKRELLSLGAYVLMFIAACIGGWLGGSIGSKRRGDEGLSTQKLSSNDH